MTDKENLAAALAAELDKSIGGSDDNQEVKYWLDTGFPHLNKIISGRIDGGLGFGRLYEIFGPSSVGKTALATKVMVEAQRLGGCAIFIDYEHTFDVGMAQRSMGLNTTSPYWIYKQPETWEQGNAIACRAVELIRKSGAIDAEAPIVVVQDSIAAAVPKSMLYDSKGNRREMDEYTMNDTTALARVTSTTLKVIAALTERSMATFVYLNQIRTKPGVLFGDPTGTPGGQAMEFYASGRLSLGRSTITEGSGMDKELTGQIIRAKCVKSKHTRPFGTAELSLHFDDTGMAYFDDIESIITWMIRQKILETSGSRINWGGKSLYKKDVIKALHKAENGKKLLIDVIRKAVPVPPGEEPSA